MALLSLKLFCEA